ncbi:dienelactone hydrolase-like protein [Caballeronia glebae]|uniref:Dienelactone hydrolase-like protein n=1 Tax=Caballeronia glebae TaxID=1777143 RepID=A0A157ZX44_9BURK|nr:dienelactone hydrolase [Caballeronia glebae]SAK50104.1 dienelactone hydrolase-like protein [Caballeronia glebae]
MRNLFVATLLSMIASSGYAAGIRFFVIPADAGGPALQAVVWTPCAVAPEPIKVGPYRLQATKDCPTVGDARPLVVLSHGHGGARLDQHDLAETLADAGFIVAAISHPGDTATDMSRTNEASVFVERPNDIKRLIDYMLGSSADVARIDARAIGFFGFSRGGFTGLVLADGVPDFQHADIPCPDELPICKLVREGKLPPQQWTHDARIKAFVLADPLDAFPTAPTVAHIRAPIQLWASEYGGDGVLPETTPALAKLLPVQPEYHLVEGAAHFAFLPPCSDELAAIVPRICVDGQGYDRAAFHNEFNRDVLAFFRAELLQASNSNAAR